MCASLQAGLVANSAAQVAGSYCCWCLCVRLSQLFADAPQLGCCCGVIGGWCAGHRLAAVIVLAADAFHIWRAAAVDVGQGTLQPGIAVAAEPKAQEDVSASNRTNIIPAGAGHQQAASLLEVLPAELLPHRHAAGNQESASCHLTLPAANAGKPEVMLPAG